MNIDRLGSVDCCQAHTTRAGKKELATQAVPADKRNYLFIDRAVRDASVD